MENILKIKKTTTKTKTSSKKVVHKAKALTPSDVQANRSMAYTYLNL